MKVKPSRNGKITLSFIMFIDIGKPCLSREFFTSLIRLLMLFAKIKFSQKFPNQQYPSVQTLVLGARKNLRIETIPYMFWLRNEKIIFNYSLLF